MSSEESTQDVDIRAELMPDEGSSKLEPSVTESATPDINPIEAEARKKGWDPEKGSKTAQQFLDAEPYLDEIKARGKQLKELEKKLDALTSHMEVERRKGYKQALDDVQRKRSDAIALGDEKSVNEADAEMRQLQESLPTEPSPYHTPEVQSFQEKNKSWLNDYKTLEHADMNRFFIDRCNQLESAGVNDPNEAVRILESDLKKKFSSYFNKDGDTDGYSPTISDANRTSTRIGNRKISFKDLDEQQKTACRYLVRRGVMSEEEYIQDLVKLGDIK